MMKGMDSSNSSSSCCRSFADMAPLLMLLLCILLPTGCSYPLCTDSMPPVELNKSLNFCSYNAISISCCNTTVDAALAKQFAAMNISDTACATAMKSILCAKCNPYSYELFKGESELRTVPILCNSSASSTVSSKDNARNYCNEVWNSCENATISNSPFATLLQGSASLPNSPSKLKDSWQSVTDFCASFGGSPGDQSACFDGNSVSFNDTQGPPAPKGLCLERIGNGSYLNLAPHPDGSNRVFLSSQAGKIWLATVPEQGSGGTLEIDEANPFLDITDEVHFDEAFGLMGIAFHPKFTTNGRFFVSYNCDETSSISCSGRCACNSDVNCDPSKLGTDNGAQPCQFQSVVAEYSTDNSASSYSLAKYANPMEVRRIFTMGLPYTAHHAGQILFGPDDGYLYFMMGDGGNKGDPNGFSQNKKSLLGKIMRLDIDNLPSESDISNLSLWGNYTIPKDNPYTVDSELRPEIWALGMRNPWRCSFDSERHSYFYCADDGQETYEEVDLISKGGNYGWSKFEGPYVYNINTDAGTVRNTSVFTDDIFPVMGYNHSSINAMGSASIIGGYVYRGSTDPCLSGRYVYADLYAANMWTGIETPEGSGNYTTTPIPFSCSKDTPIPCDTAAGSSLPALVSIFSFGEDNSKDLFVLTSKGVYRVVRPSLCNYTCPTEKAVVPASNGSVPGPSASAAVTVSVPAKAIAVSLVGMLWMIIGF